MESQSTTTERFNTVVIGAGQSGLATGYRLAKHGVDFVILEGGQRVGDAWRNRWDSLRLFTPVSLNNLPGGFDFPGDAKKWYLPTKDEAADYMEKYAEHFDLPIRLGVKVERLTRDGDRYLIVAGKHRYEADNVVVATGTFNIPKIPAFASELDPSIVQMHSSAYRNPSQVQEGDVLVVGAATSGCQIAMELAKSHRVFLAGRGVGAIPRRILGINIFRLFRFISGAPRTSFLGKKLYAKFRYHGYPLVRFSYRDVVRTGVERRPRVAGVRDGMPVLDDGEVLNVANVIWCTGYTPSFTSWTDLPIFEDDGFPRHDRGLVEGEPGLFYMGLAFQHSMSSTLLYGTDRDSKYVVDELLRRNVTNRPALVAKAS